MAIAHVQTQSANGNSGSASKVFDAAAGNTLVVILSTDGTNTPTQTAGQTLTSRRTYSNSGEVIYFYELVNVQEASQTFTFTFTSQPWSLFIMEFSGLDGTTAYRAASSADGAFVGPATTTASPTSGTTTADEVLIVCWNQDGSAGGSATGVDNSFTIPTNGDLTSAANGPATVAYRIVASASTYSTTLTTTDAISATRSITGWIGAAGAAARIRPSTLGLLGVQ